MAAPALSPQDVETKYDYNDDGLLRTASWSFPDGTSYQFEREYDSLGRLSRLGYPDEPGGIPRFTIEQRYNSAGYLRGAWDVSDPSWEPLYEVTSRSVDLALGQRKLGTKIDSTRKYDAATGRLSSIYASGSNGGYQLEYDYHPGGSVKSRTDLSTTTKRIETFDYDDLDRLAYWQLEYGGSKYTEKYDYDPSGNIESVSVNGGALQLHEYDPVRKHLLVKTPAGTFSYDDRGRQETAPLRAVTYTAFDLPRTINGTTFQYDAFGDRVRKAGPSDDVITLDGLYERRKVGSSVEHVFYVQSEEGTVAQVAWKEGANPTEQTTLFMETDALGSVGFIANPAAGSTTRLYYDPFGTRIKPSGEPDAAPADVKLGFTGHRHDDELGLVDMKGRVYDPLQRRFLTADPFVSDPWSHQAHNRYAYAGNNPLRFTDPTGFSQSECEFDTGRIPAAASIPRSDVHDDPAKKKIQAQPDARGSDGTAASAPQEPADATSYASTPATPMLDESVGGDTVLPDAPTATPESEEHPDQTFARTLAVGLANLVVQTIPTRASLGDYAEAFWNSQPAVRTVKGAIGLVENVGKAVASPDMNDAAEGAAGVVVHMVGTLVAAVTIRAAVGGTKIPNSELKSPPPNRGNAPIGKDGHPVELHHRGQKPNSPLDEMTRTDHRGKGNFTRNHSNTGQKPSKIDRSEWKHEQKSYWNEEWDSGRFDDL